MSKRCLVSPCCERHSGMGCLGSDWSVCGGLSAAVYELHDILSGISRLNATPAAPLLSSLLRHACRYGLVRVRENAESIAFYGGEGSEQRLLGSRLGTAVANYAQLLIASRNLQFFTSFYRRASLAAARLYQSACCNFIQAPSAPDA